MKETIYEVIVVGAGFSGLSASFHLKKYGLSHMVFERRRIGESWRSQRWDSFHFNSTNKLNVLPGEKEPDDPDKFGMVPQFVSSLEQYVSRHELPVKEDSKVISVEKNGEFFLVTVSSHEAIEKYKSRQVLIASGAANEISIPSVAKNISKDITQLHTCGYKNPAQLPAGAVLVIGGGQSGIQITEDLLHAGKKVYLSTSKVGRIPRWYRGKDIFYWVQEMKIYDIKIEELDDPEMAHLRPPHVSGTGTGKHSLSLQSLAKQGAVVLGKLTDTDKHRVFFQPNAAEHVKFADDFSRQIKKTIDDYIKENDLPAPHPHDDEADLPDVDAACASSITFLDLQENNINTIIWSTGFAADHSYIKLPVFDNDGNLILTDGLPEFPGLYFLGYPWLRSRKSPILFGIIVDVEFVVEKIYSFAKEKIRPMSAGI
ncbi:MAG TPA: NAD(P)/FAD-dependent oxidoreductase [Chitinophagaceae bacterium]|nr:NAD(P)/FAD-dependent oxidoreductase [Chitinophagaceae bacterium]